MRARNPSSKSLLLGLTGLGLTGCFNRDCERQVVAAERPPAPKPPPIDGSGPPQVIAAQWVDEGVLELQFSEPLEPPDSVDPLRFVVLVADIDGYKNNYGECHVQTAYHLPPTQDSDPDFASSYPASLSLAPDDASRLRLGMNLPLRCSDGPGAGLMLIYADDPDPHFDSDGVIQDLTGARMLDLGPAWAIEGAVRAEPDQCSSKHGPYYPDYCYMLDNDRADSFPRLDTLLPIPCPP